MKDEYVNSVIEEYAKPLVENPRKDTDNHSSIIEDLPPAFAICESRMNKIMAKNNNADNNPTEENEDEQKQLLQNLINDLRESKDEEFELEDVDHNYLSDESEEEEFPEIEFDPLQYSSVRSLSLQNEDPDSFKDIKFWSARHIECDVDELLKTL